MTNAFAAVGPVILLGENYEQYNGAGPLRIGPISPMLSNRVMSPYPLIHSSPIPSTGPLSLSLPSKCQIIKC